VVISSGEDRRAFRIFAVALFAATALLFADSVVAPLGYSFLVRLRGPRMSIGFAAIPVAVAGALLLWWLLTPAEIAVDRECLEVRDRGEIRVVPLAAVGRALTIPLWRWVRVVWLVGLRVPRPDSRARRPSGVGSLPTHDES